MDTMFSGKSLLFMNQGSVIFTSIKIAEDLFLKTLLFFKRTFACDCSSGQWLIVEMLMRLKKEEKHV